MLTKEKRIRIAKMRYRINTIYKTAAKFLATSLGATTSIIDDPYNLFNKLVLCEINSSSYYYAILEDGKTFIKVER